MTELVDIKIGYKLNMNKKYKDQKHVFLFLSVLILLTGCIQNGLNKIGTLTIPDEVSILFHQKTVQNDKYIYAFNTNNIFVFEISPMETLEFYRAYKILENPSIIDFVIKSKYAYLISSETDTLDTIRMDHDDNSFEKMGSIRFSHTPVWVFVDNNRLIVHERHNTSPPDKYGTTNIFDISNPENPTLMASHYGLWLPFGVADGIIFAVRRDSAGHFLYMVDIADPKDPKTIYSQEMQSFYPKDVEVAGSYIYISGLNGISVYKFSKSQNPILLGEENEVGMVGSIKVNGKYLYFANIDGGFGVIDISDPKNMKKVFRKKTHGEWYNLEVYDGAVYFIHSDKIDVYGEYSK